MSDYSDIFGRDPEPWRGPLGALRLTLADEQAPPWQLERARSECEALVKILNEYQTEHDRQVAEKALRRYAEALTENPSSDSWPASAVPADIEDWVKHLLAEHVEPHTRAEYEKEQSDGK